MSTAAATPPKATDTKKVKPKPTPAELRTAVGLPESATDAELRAAQKVKRFKDVAGKRTNRALESMANLARCANRGNYTYTAEQVDTILVALEDEVEKLRGAFNASAGADKPHITL